jgi:hypothetical protein
MLSGQKIDSSIVYMVAMVLVFLIESCKKKESQLPQFFTDRETQILINDSIYMDIKWYENGLINTLTTKDKLGIKNGLNLEYHTNGILKTKFFWKNNMISGGYWIYNDTGELQVFYNYIDGDKNGNMYEYDAKSSIKSHFIFKDGKAIYVSSYDNGEKNISSAIPVFSDEKFINDSIYNVKISFPYPYRGELDIFLRDTINFTMKSIDKYNIELTITNFDRNWAYYEFLLEYEPAEDDSLSRTEQIYKRVLEIN